MIVYLTLNITTTWILKFTLNWVRCLICGCKFITGFGHQRDIWPLTPKKSNHHYHYYHHDSNPSVNKFLLCLSRACFFLKHKTSVAIKVQTRKNLLFMCDSTLEHSSSFSATQLFSQETTSKRKLCTWNKWQTFAPAEMLLFWRENCSLYIE